MCAKTSLSSFDFYQMRNIQPIITIIYTLYTSLPPRPPTCMRSFEEMGVDADELRKGNKESLYMRFGNNYTS